MQHKNTRNFADIIGFVGVNPEIRITSNGTPVTNFTIGTNRPLGNGNEAVDWHRIVVFGKLAESTAKNAVKGRHIAVTGRMQTRSWEDENGVRHYSTEIVAESIMYLDNKRPQENPPKPQTNTANATPETNSGAPETPESPDDIAALADEAAGELLG